MSEHEENQLLSITEVANLLQVPQHVLRVWEGQYNAITPTRGRNGRRYYSPETIDIIRKVQDYSVNQGMDSSAIRQMLDNTSPSTSLAASPHVTAKAQPDIDTDTLQTVIRLLEKAGQALAR